MGKNIGKRGKKSFHEGGRGGWKYSLVFIFDGKIMGKREKKSFHEEGERGGGFEVLEPKYRPLPSSLATCGNHCAETKSSLD